MSADPYADLNRVHREQIDTPWTTPPRRHVFRDPWREGQQPRHLNADDFDRAPLAVKIGRWLLRRAWLFVAVAIAAAAWFAGSLVYALIAWHWD